VLIAKFLYKLYGIDNRRIRNVILKIFYHLEEGEIYSITLRKIFRDYHNVEIGMYTHGGCFIPGNVDRFTTIGKYCSIGRSVKIFNRNHPVDFKSMHGFFFNPGLRFCSENLVDYIPLTICNDVWIGDRAIVMPNVKHIGDGAVIGAGAVVNKNVPPYAVVVGNPARVVRYRFPKEIIEELLASKWWEKSIEEINLNIEEFQQPYEKLYFSKGRKKEEKKASRKENSA
jgi:virginiamycin A acetyltransferase